MVNRWKHNGFSLIELIVALGIIAALVGLAIPAINAMQKSYDSTGAESMINAALSTARTLAISKQQYAGVRFQKAWKPSGDVLKAEQYMIFVIYQPYDSSHNLSTWFHSIVGYKPIKLPNNVGIINMTDINGNTDVDSDDELVDATSFSVVFSPAGKLVIHEVKICNVDCYRDITSQANKISSDMVFNKEAQVEDGNAMFVQDDYSSYGLVKEQSRNKFRIYDCRKFEKLSDTERYDYLKTLNDVNINPYTGEIIK